jgi:hypothetical protein
MEKNVGADRLNIFRIKRLEPDATIYPKCDSQLASWKLSNGKLPDFSSNTTIFLSHDEIDGGTRKLCILA